MPLWSITAKNTDCSTGPLARPFAHSLTHSLAPDCSLCSHPPLRSLVRSLAHFANSLACGTLNDWMTILSVSFSIFDHSARRIFSLHPSSSPLYNFVYRKKCAGVENMTIFEDFLPKSLFFGGRNSERRHWSGRNLSAGNLSARILSA